jgi:hypothetical protein
VVLAHPINLDTNVVLRNMHDGANMQELELTVAPNLAEKLVTVLMKLMSGKAIVMPKSAVANVGDVSVYLGFLVTV